MTTPHPTPLSPPTAEERKTAQIPRKVTAWFSKRHGAWLMSLSAGASGTRVTFTPEQGVQISNDIINTIEALEEKNGPIA